MSNPGGFQRVTLAEATVGPLYIGFSKGNGVVSALIRWFEGAQANHAFLLYRDEHLGWMTLGANSNGVTYLPLDVFLRDRTIVDIYVPRDDPAILWKALDELKNDIGERYNYSGLIGMAPVEIAQRWLHIKCGENWTSDPHRLFCSQFVSDLLLKAHLFPTELMGRPANTIDPAALDAAMAA